MQQQEFQFTCLPFEQLSVQELYDIMVLRQAIFVVEQDCPYLDADGIDSAGWHLMGRNPKGKLVLYTRLLPKGISYKNYTSIGRVVNHKSTRGMGAGQLLMWKSIELCRHLFGNEPIKIGAQTYLLEFYGKFGFQSTGENYLEDGIPHTKMVLPAL